MTAREVPGHSPPLVWRGVVLKNQAVGAAACIVVGLVLLLAQGHVQHTAGPAAWDKVLPVYRLSAMPILGMWLWGLNVLIWYRARVNHAYIFDLNPTSALSHIHIFKVGADRPACRAL